MNIFKLCFYLLIGPDLIDTSTSRSYSMHKHSHSTDKEDLNYSAEFTFTGKKMHIHFQLYVYRVSCETELPHFCNKNLIFLKLIDNFSCFFVHNVHSLTCLKKSGTRSFLFLSCATRNLPNSTFSRKFSSNQGFWKSRKMP